MFGRLDSEVVTGLQLAAVDGGLFRIDGLSHGACCPAEIEIGTEREDHRSAVDFCLDADAFLCQWQCEVQCSSEENGEEMVDVGVDGGVVDLGFDKEGCCVGPVEDGGGDIAPAVDVGAGIDLCEGAGTSDAGDADIAEFISFSGVERNVSVGGLPAAIGRAERLAIARDVSLIDRFEGSNNAADVVFGFGIDDIANAEIGNQRRCRIVCCSGGRWDLVHPHNIEAVSRGTKADGDFHVAGLIVGVLEVESEESARPDDSSQLCFEVSRGIGVSDRPCIASREGDHGVIDGKLTAHVVILAQYHALNCDGGEIGAVMEEEKDASGSHDQSRKDGCDGLFPAERKHD